MRNSSEPEEAEEADFGDPEEEEEEQGEEEEEERPARTRGEAGGKRQKRRIALANARLASGELSPADIRLEKHFERFIIRNNEEGVPVLIPPSQQTPEHFVETGGPLPLVAEVPPWRQPRAEPVLRAEVYEAEAGTLGVRVRVGATPKWKAQPQQQPQQLQQQQQASTTGSSSSRDPAPSLEVSTQQLDDQAALQRALRREKELIRERLRKVLENRKRKRATLLSPEQIERIKKEIQEAESIEEVERLHAALLAGRETPLPDPVRDAEHKEAIRIEVEQPLCPIALDLHNSLDDGSEEAFIPSVHIRAVERLLEANFLVWICSYIGRYGQDSAHRRARAELRRKDLARAVGLSSAPVDCPTEGHLFLCIVDRKLWSDSPLASCNFNGKAVALEHFGTRFLVDDNVDICEECCTSAILAYQCASTGRPKQQRLYKDPFLAAEQLEHVGGYSFDLICSDIIEDRNSGALWQKLHVLEMRARLFGVRRF